MFRCMTCDVRKRGKPVLVEMPNDEAIGLCVDCSVIVRSYETLVALAKGEYDAAQAEAKCGESLCCDDPDCADKDGFACEGEKCDACGTRTKNTGAPIIDPLTGTTLDTTVLCAVCDLLGPPGKTERRARA